MGGPRPHSGDGGPLRASPGPTVATVALEARTSTPQNVLRAVDVAVCRMVDWTLLQLLLFQAAGLEGIRGLYMKKTCIDQKNININTIVLNRAL